MIAKLVKNRGSVMIWKVGALLRFARRKEKKEEKSRRKTFRKGCFAFLGAL